MSDETRLILAPPDDLVLNARAVMGAIDYDPFSTPDVNRLVGAAKIEDRNSIQLDDVIAADWVVPGEGRVLVNAPPKAADSRRLLNKTLREYRKGTVQQAVLWIPNNETLIRLPWLWDFPVCIPFRRLRPNWWDEELEVFRGVSLTDWSAVFYLPPAAPSTLFASKLARFHTAFSHMGRVVFNELSGEGDWEKTYRIAFKKPFDYRG